MFNKYIVNSMLGVASPKAKNSQVLTMESQARVVRKRGGSADHHFLSLQLQACLR